MNREGYIFAPYIIAENINIVSESNTNPIQGISSRYAWKSKSEIRIDKIRKILESIDS